MPMENHKSTANTVQIAVVGNSVAMRVRPPKNPPENKNYTMHLREGITDSNGVERDVHVVNLSSGGDTLREVHNRLNDIIRLFPDYYILNLGVVDASTRDIPRWFFNIVNSTRQSGFHRVIRYFHGGIIKRIRRQLVLIRGKRSWIRIKVFKRLYIQLIDKLLKETNAELIGLSINLANERVEKELPGSRTNHEKYNNIIKECFDQPRCNFLDLTDLIPEKDFPDGVHFSAEGHRLVADRIRQMINP